jgi:HK97 family phage major capsid protein
MNITEKKAKFLELTTKAKTAYADLETKKGQGEDVTAEDVQFVEDIIADGKALRVEIELEEGVSKMTDFAERPVGERQSSDLRQKREKSWGEIVVGSKQFQHATETRKERMERVNVKEGKDLYGSSTGAGGAFVIPQRADSVMLPHRQYSILDLVNILPVNSNTVEYVEMTSRTNSAAPVADYEGAPINDYGPKPKSTMVFSLNTATVQTIAHYIPAARTILQDAPQLRGLIDTELVELLREELEDQVLNGDGVSPNLAGILQTLGIQTRTQADTSDRGGLVTDTKADALRRAVTDIRLELYEVNGIVLNPADGESIELDKNANGDYVSLYDSTTGQLWRVNVVETPAITVGTALVGNFFLGSTLWDRANTEIRVGEPNDYFLRNAVAILAELRVAFAVKRALAFEKLTFA